MATAAKRRAPAKKAVKRAPAKKAAKRTTAKKAAKRAPATKAARQTKRARQAGLRPRRRATAQKAVKKRAPATKAAKKRAPAPRRPRSGRRPEGGQEEGSGPQGGQEAGSGQEGGEEAGSGRRRPRSGLRPARRPSGARQSSAPSRRVCVEDGDLRGPASRSPCRHATLVPKGSQFGDAVETSPSWSPAQAPWAASCRRPVRGVDGGPVGSEPSPVDSHGGPVLAPVGQQSGHLDRRRSRRRFHVVGLVGFPQQHRRRSVAAPGQIGEEHVGPGPPPRRR